MTQAPFLADARLILKEQANPLGGMGRGDFLQTVAEPFFESAPAPGDRHSGETVMTSDILGFPDMLPPPLSGGAISNYRSASLGIPLAESIHQSGSISRDEIQAILHQIAIYCGVPVGVECFRIARRVFAEKDEGG